jgi:CheY-like chemotaxis protein
VQTLHPDLVLLDIRLSPSPNDRLGLVILRQLRATMPRLPIIVLTGLEEPDVYETAMALGASAFIPKPIDRQNLLAHVQKTLAHVVV